MAIDYTKRPKDFVTGAPRIAGKISYNKNGRPEHKFVVTVVNPTVNPLALKAGESTPGLTQLARIAALKG